MPLLSALAGRSPNCCAVRVQIEHCALTGNVAADNNKTPMRIAGLHMDVRFEYKDRTYHPTSSVFMVRATRFRSSSSKMDLRSLIFLGVTSIHSSSWMYSMHSSSVICFLGM